MAFFTPRTFLAQLGAGERKQTLPFNGDVDLVAKLYEN